MEIEPLRLRGAALLRGIRHRDDRGHLRKVVVMAEAARHGYPIAIDEVVSTENTVAGTVRGMHYQVAPRAETKTLWVTRGELHDVLVDLRPDEPTFGTWVAVTLAESDDVALHVPPGVAHGYQTLADDTCLTYLINGIHSPAQARTLRWDDPTLAITWPREVARISDRDREGHAWPPPD